MDRGYAKNIFYFYVLTRDKKEPVYALVTGGVRGSLMILLPLSSFFDNVLYDFRHRFLAKFYGHKLLGARFLISLFIKPPAHYAARTRTCT